MTTISLAEAQAKLPELIAAVGRGEKIVVTIDERPVARIESAEAVTAEVDPEEVDDRSEREKAMGYGCLKGKIWMADDFDAPLEDFADYM